MYRPILGAPLVALTLLSSALAQASPAQYALTDLGSLSVAGGGLTWQTPQGTTAPPNFPSTASLSGYPCYTTNTNEIYAEYGNEAVGTTCIAGGPGWHAAKWTWSGTSNPVLTDLGALPGAGGGPNTDGPVSEANGFNSVGDIVGGADSQYSEYKNDIEPAHHAFDYYNGVMTDLGSIAGVNFYSEAYSVNDSREIVGVTNTISSVDGSILYRAFLYTGGTMYNLTFYEVGGPTVLLTNAVGIDCQGNIAAIGTPAAGGTSHSYLLVRQGAARTCPN